MGKPSPNNGRLRELMDAHGLTYAEVAELCRTSVATVTSWLRPEGNAAHRGMPDAHLELLELKLGEKKL